MRSLSFAALALTLAACTTVADLPSPEAASQQLADAERAWLDAYVDNDRAAMGEALAEGFTITFPNGHVDTRADVIAGLVPSAGPSEGPTHFTEDRTIRVLGATAILSGVYVSPRSDGTATRMRYTDTWMWIDGRWRVVASHLSEAGG